MKKIVLSIAAIIFIAGNSIAQENSPDLRDKFMFGVKGGLNYSNVYDTQGDEFKADPKLGLVAGGFLSIPIGKYLGVQPEILYSQKGFKATGRALGSTYEFTRTTSYIDIPLMIQLKPSGMVTIMAGPQYSYLIKQKDVFTNSTASVAQEDEFKNDNIRKNIMSFIGGVDLNLNNFVIGARVGWDVQTNNGDGTSSTPRYKNVWYQATLGYRFY